VLTENREEVEIRIQDDDMGERAQEIGLLMGDEDPRMTQTAAAQREAEAQRATAVPGEGVEGGELEPADEEEEEEEEIDDSKPIVTGPVGGSMGSAEADMQVTGAGIRGNAADFEDLEIEEEPVEEDEDEEQGYVLEEEDEDVSEEASPYGEDEEESEHFHETEEEF
jgi:hypothetical protein